MKTYHYLIQILSLLLIAGLVHSTGCTNALEADPVTLSNSQMISAEVINELPFEEVSPEEANGLVFIREEEKLARDVYINLSGKWGQRVFSNISKSEQSHMDAIKHLLDKYEINDPVTDDVTGIFKNEDLQTLYATLIEQGNLSLIEALKAGALIEEIDITDIKTEMDENVDNEDITIVYTNLLKGSRNHLRAFVKNLSRQGITYTPQKLTEEEFMTIINTGMERGRR